MALHSPPSGHKYDGTDFTVRFGWYDAAVLRNAGTDCTDC